MEMIRGYCLLALLIAVPCAALGEETPDRQEEARVVASFTIAPHGVVVLPVQLEDKTYHFALSTLLPFSTIRSSLKEELGAEIDSRSVPSLARDMVPNEKFYYAPQGMRLGPIELSETAIIRIDDWKQTGRLMHQRLGVEIDGFIGMDVLANFVLEVDPSKERVRFLKGPIPESPEVGVALPFLDGNRGLPMVQAKISGKPGVAPLPVIVELGYSGALTVGKPTFDVLRGYGLLTHISRAKPNQPVNLAGRGPGKSGVVPRFSIGGLDGKDVELESTYPTISIVGWRVLEHFCTTFDFPAKKLYLRKLNGANWTDGRDMSGLSLEKDRAGIRIVETEYESPATAAGCRPGDILTSIDGHPPSDYTLYQLRRLFSVAGETRKLTLRRDGQPIEAKISLQEYRIFEGEEDLKQAKEAANERKTQPK
jgi:PDZ domain